MDRLSIDGDLVASRDDLCAQFLHGLTVDRDPALQDVILARPARAYTRVGENLLEPLRGGVALESPIRSLHRATFDSILRRTADESGPLRCRTLGRSTSRTVPVAILGAELGSFATGS